MPYEDLWWERSIRSVANVTRDDVREFLELATVIPVRTRIEVLDLDLAGWARFGGRAPNEIRTVRGGADFPAMRVRYTLESSSRPQSGEEDLKDLGYQNHGLASRGASEPFYYEKRMVEDWIRSRFAQRSP